MKPIFLVTRQQNKLVAIKQELVFKQNQLTELGNQVESNTQQLSNAAQLIEEGQQALIDSEALFVQMLRRKEEEQQKLNEADQAYYNLRNALQAKESELRHKVKSRRLLNIY